MCRRARFSDEAPLRAEVFSVEQLVHHAKALAENHPVVTQRGSNRLLARLGENEQILRAYNRATQAVDQTRRVTHAAEWLLDNFYLIEEQIQMARRHLPRGYSRELPRLLSGPSAGLPRVYDLVLELISHVDAQIDAEPLRAFIAAYQTVSALKLGELWAIPIMLRLALIENLRRVTSRLMIARHDRDLADLWVERLQEMAEKNPSHLVVVVADMAQSTLPLSSAFVAEFSQRLSRQSPAMHLARTWLEQRLTDQGLSIEQLVQLESQNQAADQVSVSHTINSLRFLGALDWREFVEAMSQVDQTLRLDPAGVYGNMDFFTRDRYRHSVETISRHSRLLESEVAQKAIQLAEASAREKGIQDRTAHVGFYLIDKGLAALERAAEMRQPWQTAIERRIHRFPLAFYGGRSFVAHGVGNSRVNPASAGARGAGLEAGFLHARVPPLFQPTGRRVDELAFHLPGQTLPAAALGLLRRHRARVPDHGGRADHVDQFRGGRPAGRNVWRFIIWRTGTSIFISLC